jgi:erythromycin esterase-like protein
LPESYEALLHETGIAKFLLTWDDARVRTLFDEWMLERAIGVIHMLETERQSHYFYATLPAQFDAVLHFDQTQAVEPLDDDQIWIDEEAPETFPTGV